MLGVLAMESDDWKLIRAWQGGAQEAFTELVRRHLPLVHAAARRQLGDAHLVDDVAQAVFLLLARKASSLPRSTVLPGWLFNTTRLVVRHTIRSESRRRQRELLAASMDANPTSTPSPDASWDRAGAALDEALAQLAAADRDALLLRFTEGRNHREVGVALGIGEEAARKRVDRALERLRVRLAGAGITFATVTLSTFLQDRLAAAPTSGLVERIAGAAFGDPLGHPLVEAVVAAEQQARWVQWGAVATGVAVCVTGLVAWLGGAGFSAASAPGSPAAGAALSESVALPAPVPASVSPSVADAVLPFRTNAVPFLLRVVAGAESRPVAGARVFVNYVVGAGWIPLSGFRTDDNGLCAIPLPEENLGRLDVAADSPGLGTRSFKWISNWGTPCPVNYILRLQPGVAIGGVVLGTNGAPLAGTAITIAYNNGDSGWDDPELVAERPGYLHSVPGGVTDATGRWAFSSIPPDLQGFRIELLHPDHAPAVLYVNPVAPSEKVVWAHLQGHQLTNRLDFGHSLAGLVVDPEGRPVEGVHISNQEYLTNGVTGSDGSFVLRPVRPEHSRVSLWARGFAARSVQLKLDRPSQRVELERGGLIRVRVVTPDGGPVAGAHVHLLDSGLDPAVNWHWACDADGRMEWDSAPASVGFRFHVSAPGYRARSEVSLTVSEEESVILLDPSPMVEFVVTDAESGLLIPSFKVIPGARMALDSDLSLVPYQFDVSASRVGQDGGLRLELGEAVVPIYQIEANGYLPAIVAPGPPIADGGTRVECRMKPMREADRIRGRVLDGNGRPVASVEVGLTTLSTFIEVGRGRLGSDQARFITRTDADGRFELKPQPDGVWMVAAHPSGFARVRLQGGGDHEMILELLGSIEGRWLDVRGKPVAGRHVSLGSPVSYPGMYALSSTMFTVKTWEDGGFAFDAIPPGRWRLQAFPLSPGAAGAVSDFLPKVECVEIGPGGRIEGFELGRGQAGAVTVTGRFVSPLEEPIGDWRPLLNHASLRAVVVQRTPPGDLPVDQRRAWMVDWSDSLEAFEAACAERDYPLSVAADGSFEAHEVPPGEYRLLCIVIGGGGTLKKLGELESRPWSASIQTNIVVGVPADGSRNVVEVGGFEVKIRR